MSRQWHADHQPLGLMQFDVVLTRERQVALIDVANGRQLCPLSGFRDEICGCDYSPDGNTLATIDVDSNLRQWEAKPFDT